MKSYSWLAVRGQLRTGALIAGVMVGVVVPRVGLGQINPGVTLPFLKNSPGSVSADNGSSAQAKPEESDSSTTSDSKPDETPASPAISGNHGTENTPPEEQKEKEKKDEDKGGDSPANSAEKVVEGITVNGQKLHEQTVDGETHRYYYVNGDTKSPFISMENKDGSFKWTTKDAMLNPVKPGNYGEIGMIETNGSLSKVYQLPDGSRAFRSGDSWLKANPGQNTLTQVDSISFKNGSGTLTQYPGVGYTEPYKFDGGSGSDALFGGKQPSSASLNGVPPQANGGAANGASSGSVSNNSELSGGTRTPPSPLAQSLANKALLKSGPYAASNAEFRAQIDRLTPTQAEDLVRAFRSAPSNSMYSNCPSCYFGAGGGRATFDKTVTGAAVSNAVPTRCVIGPDGKAQCK